MKSFKRDLRWFLFEEHLELQEKNGLDSSNILLESLKNYSKLFKNPLLKLVLKGFRGKYSLSSPLFFNKNGKTILFQNGVSKYRSIFNKADSSNNNVVLGLRSSFLADFIFKKTLYYPVFDDAYLDLNLGILNNDDDKLYACLDKLTAVFDYLNPDVVVLNDDGLPFSRALILVSNELNIPTVEIQHGVYQSGMTLTTGNYSDYVFVWGEYFKNIYLNQNLRQPNTIKILGYPYEIKNFKTIYRNPKVVYYLSEDYEHYNPESMKIKKETISELNALCNEIGLQFIYRPHPEEDVGKSKSSLINIKFSKKKETLQNSFENGDIFISFNSTALIEAALQSKISIQLKYYPILSDDFEELGICPSFNNIEEIRTHLKNLSNSKNLSQYNQPVNDQYIEKPSPDPGTRFLELINEII